MLLCSPFGHVAAASPTSAEKRYCQFLYHGRRHTFTIGNVQDDEAETKAGQVDYLLMRLRQGLLQLPAGVDIVTFVQFDGKPPEALAPAAHSCAPAEPDVLTLGTLRDRYVATHANGSLENSTLYGIKLHFRHLATTLGERFPIQKLGLADLQQHVDRRAKMKGLKGKLSPATIRKELVTLRTVWNWGVQMKLVEGRFPNKGLTYPKFHEKPPFQTYTEIERQIAAGGLKPVQIAELWTSRDAPRPDLGR